MHEEAEDEWSAYIFKLIIQNHGHTMSSFQLFTLITLICSANTIVEAAATIVDASAASTMMEADHYS